MRVAGKVWKFGDSIDTDIIIPARYLVLPLEEMKEKTMEPLCPTFSTDFKRGGVIVAGKNFGCGSSREQAPAVLKALGVTAIIADSFARIFYRNAINLGVPVVECPGFSQHVQEGDTVEIELATGKIRLGEQGSEFSGSNLPDFLLEIIEDGGLVQNLTKCRRPIEVPEVSPDSHSVPPKTATLVKKTSLNPIEFDGLRILDYTANSESSSSLAQVIVPVGGKHRRAWSRRSDKYYLVLSGEIQFKLDDGNCTLATGDLCVIQKGRRFSYFNDSNQPVSMVLVHTPSFDIESEVFEE